MSQFSQLISARYFEYLLTRFRSRARSWGRSMCRRFARACIGRRGERLLPTAEVVFLDEIFKANSAILNSLLSLLNERRLYIGAERIDVPLLALFAASNELPDDDSLEALLDRFVLRIRSGNVQSYHFHGLITLGLTQEARGPVTGGARCLPPTSCGCCSGVCASGCAVPMRCFRPIAIWCFRFAAKASRCPIAAPCAC